MSVPKGQQPIAFTRTLAYWMFIIALIAVLCGGVRAVTNGTARQIWLGAYQQLLRRGVDPAIILFIVFPFLAFGLLALLAIRSQRCPHCGRRAIRVLRRFRGEPGMVLHLFGCRACKRKVLSWDGGRTCYDPIACGLDSWLAQAENPRLDTSELTLEEVRAATVPGLLLKNQRQIRMTAAWAGLLPPRRLRMNAHEEAAGDFVAAEVPAEAVGRMESLVTHQRERKRRAGGDEPGR